MPQAATAVAGIQSSFQPHCLPVTAEDGHRVRTGWVGLCLLEISAVKYLSRVFRAVQDGGVEPSPESMPECSTSHEREAFERELLAAIRSRRARLARLLDKASGHWGYEDAVYRFYHQSFKVFSLQETTAEIVAEMQGLLPARALNPWFLQIIGDGAGHRFEMSCNRDWLRHTRPILEAFFHARFMLEMALRYADLEEPPSMLPSGWAALLYLYGLR